jgi:hypothetical protein
MIVAVDPPTKAVSHGDPRPFLLSKFCIASRYRELTIYDRMILTQSTPLKPVVSLLKNISGTHVVRETVAQRYQFHRDLPIEGNIRTVYLVGYWQAYRYADEIADELRTEFAFREPAQGKNLDVLKQIDETDNPVSLHIRRGDLTLPAEGNIALPIGYYHKAIRFFRERLDHPKFFVFSDDMGFAKQNLPRTADFVLVDHNDSRSAHEDLRLMSSCRDHIIANSTLSWWGAWLNPGPAKIVLSPKYWHLKPDSYFPDLLPPAWILVR